jgi:hypothetical protein
VRWLTDISARKERAALDKVGVSKERDFYDIPTTLTQADYTEKRTAGMISPFPAIGLAKYAFVEHDSQVRLIPIANCGKRIIGRLSSDDAGWDGAANAGDDLSDRFLSAATRPDERAPSNPCRTRQPSAVTGMSDAAKKRLIAEFGAAGGKSRILPIAKASFEKLYPWPRQRARIRAAMREAAAREALAEMDRLNDAISQIINGAQHEHVGVAAA